RSVDADDEDDKGLAAGVDGQWNGAGGEDIDDGRAQRLYQSGDVRQLVARHAFLQVRQDVLCRFDADIGHEQAAFELIQNLRVDLASAEQVREVVGEPRRAPVELAAQALEKSGLRRLRGGGCAG